mgnify:FL=1
MAYSKQGWIEKVFGHKYAIDAKRLGDDSLLAWSNLGYWQNQYDDYPQACQSLADQIAASIQLKQSDHVLDLGCGQGASLLHWLRYYQIQQLSAVELQPEYAKRIQKQLAQVQIHCGSFLNLNALQLLNLFDVVLCIDAAYHSDLNSFLRSASSVLNSKGRIAFHYLMWSDRWQNCSQLQKQQYRYLLKAADVNDLNLQTESQLLLNLLENGLDDIIIQDFSEPVLNGFSNFIKNKSSIKKPFDFAQLKIEMTAKLCAKLYHDGLVRYIQVSAVKK